MGSTTIRLTISCAIVLGLCSQSAYAQSDDLRKIAIDAIRETKSWLGTDSNADAWRRYLHLDQLEQALKDPAKADAAVVERAIAQLSSGAPGLDRPQFVRLRDAVLAWWTTATYGADPDLAEAVASARKTFAAPDNRYASWVKADLQAALSRLERYLATGGQNGKQWADYLRVGDLDRQLKAEKPDIEVLSRIAQRFEADQPGLEMPVFSDVRQKLTQYIDALEVGGMQDFEQQYATQLEALSSGLGRYAKTAGESDAYAVGRSLGWLERSRQAGPLVHAVRGRHSQANLYASAAEKIISAGIERPVDEVAPVYDVILGTDISGTGHTVGRLDVELVPNPKAAVIDTMLMGNVYTRTVGYNGPATICSVGTTCIDGRKRIVFDREGFKSYPAAADASVSTRITGVSAGRGGLIQRIATKKVYQSKSTAERIASQHAEVRVANRLEREVGRNLSRSHYDYLGNFRNPLVRRGEFPQELRFSTTNDHLYVTARQVNSNQIAAATPPPKLEGPRDLAVQMHQSFANNLANGLLSGVTLHEEDLQKQVIKMRGSLPEELKTEEGRPPWSITFADERPVSVDISKDGFVIAIRGKRFTSGEDSFRAMNIVARYKVEKHDGGSRLVRQGDLEVLPPGFQPGKDRLSGQQVSLRRLLTRRFGKILKPELVSKGLELPGKWKSAGRLTLRQLSIGDGWVALAWTQDQGRHLAAQNKVAQAGPR